MVGVGEVQQARMESHRNKEKGEREKKVEGWGGMRQVEREHRRKRV